MFNNELETGTIKEGKICKKLTGKNIVTSHSVKAVVLTLHHMREEFAHTVEPPSENLQTPKK